MGIEPGEFTYEQGALCGILDDLHWWNRIASHHGIREQPRVRHGHLIRIAFSAIAGHVAATSRRNSLGLMATSEDVHQGVHGQSWRLRNIAICPMLLLRECQMILE
jgi:hypothetical protein